MEAKVVQDAHDYEQKANNEELYKIPAMLCDNDEIAEGRVTKSELKKVYTSHMVPSKKPSRVIYDKILSNAPLGKCPFCGFGHASTLDHYLPKTKFPILSVLPLNLVPCCSDCNKGKNASIATIQGEQGLHPYFDHQYYINDQWLFAEVMEVSPAVIKFYVKPPDSWFQVSKARVQTHFDDYKLASRFSTESSSELEWLHYFVPR